MRGTACRKQAFGFTARVCAVAQRFVARCRGPLLQAHVWTTYCATYGVCRTLGQGPVLQAQSVASSRRTSCRICTWERMCLAPLLTHLPATMVLHTHDGRRLHSFTRARPRQLHHSGGANMHDSTRSGIADCCWSGCGHLMQARHVGHGMDSALVCTRGENRGGNTNSL